MLVLLLSLWLLRANQSAISRASKLISLLLPLALGLASLGWYNWARFGSVWESGLYYALAGVDLQEIYDDLFSPLYVPQNVFNCLLTPIHTEADFPFLGMGGARKDPIFLGYAFPDAYAPKSTVGILPAYPIVLFAIVPCLAQLPTVRRGRQERAARNKGRYTELDWISLALAGSASASVAVLLLYFWVGVRFLEDFMPSLVLLSIVGFWQGHGALARRSLARRAYLVVGVSLGLISVLTSSLLALSVSPARLPLMRLFGLQ